VIWLAASLVAFWLCAAIGAGGAWLLRGHTTLSVRNLYLLGGATSLLCGLAILAHRWDTLLLLAPLSAGPTAGVLFGRRWRLADLGAGEELREHELNRRWFWQRGPERRPGEHVYIRSQGEIVHTRRWPEHEPYVPMTGEPHGPRLPRSEGQHIFSCGGTGPARPPARCGWSQHARSTTTPPCSRSTRKVTSKPSKCCATSPPRQDARSS
jgi:hypothetical protein